MITRDPQWVIDAAEKYVKERIYDSCDEETAFIMGARLRLPLVDLLMDAHLALKRLRAIGWDGSRIGETYVEKLSTDETMTRIAAALEREK